MSSPVRVPPLPARLWLWPVVLLVIAAAVAVWILVPHAGNADSAYRTALVERGEFRTAISATGTLSATATVEIGTQVSGTLQSVEVDFNDAVHKDQVIARIDPSTLQARLEQASAALGSTRAGLSEALAVAKNSEADYARKADLSRRQLIARADADVSLAARDQARARIALSSAQVRQQQAAVDSARLELDKTIIRSPVDGVVLLRAVEPGQTVAASLQTPVLFKIAGDLRKMEIALAIDEADIGQVRERQAVSFTVDAFPDRNFTGRVKQVRLAATNTANVITYPVVVDVENDDQTLLPGMTANAEIEISRRQDVLSIPNAALRFRPAEENAPKVGGRAIASGMRNPASGGQRPANADSRSGGARAGGGAAMIDAMVAIANRLKLDASQRAAFDHAVQALRDGAGQRRGAGTGNASSGRAAGASEGGKAAGGQGAGGQGDGGDRSRRMGERFKENFAAFRATLAPAQQAQWDAELSAQTGGKRAPVYQLVDGKPEAVTVRIGATDGTRSEIMGSELKEGELVIIGSARPTP